MPYPPFPCLHLNSSFLWPTPVTIPFLSPLFPSFSLLFLSFFLLCPSLHCCVPPYPPYSVFPFPAMSRPTLLSTTFLSFPSPRFPTCLAYSTFPFPYCISSFPSFHTLISNLSFCSPFSPTSILLPFFPSIPYSLLPFFSLLCSTLAFLRFPFLSYPTIPPYSPTLLDSPLSQPVYHLWR